MSERTSTPAASGKFDPDPSMDASIEAKIEAALAQGVDLTKLNPADDAMSASILERIGVTREEQDYMAEQTIHRMVQIEVGRRIVEVLDKHLKVVRNDIIPCLTAYFAAVDAGEVAAA